MTPKFQWLTASKDTCGACSYPRLVSWALLQIFIPKATLKKQLMSGTGWSHSKRKRVMAEPHRGSQKCLERTSLPFTFQWPKQVMAKPMQAQSFRKDRPESKGKCIFQQSHNLSQHIKIQPVMLVSPPALFSLTDPAEEDSGRACRGGVKSLLGVQVRGTGCLSLNPDSAVFQLCDPGQVI